MVVCGPASPGPQSRQDAAGFTLSRSSMLSCVRLFVTELTSPPGCSVCVISLARILEWVAISSSRGIFLTQGSNPHLLHRQVDSLLLRHQGSTPWKMHLLGMVTRQKEPGPGSSTVGWGESHEELGTGCLTSTAGCKSLAQLCEPPAAVWGQVVRVQPEAVIVLAPEVRATQQRWAGQTHLRAARSPP